MAGEYDNATRPIRQFRIEYQEYRCQCGRPIAIPIRPEWNSPLYVMEMEKRHEQIQKEIVEILKSLVELAGECVEAGVRPAMLRRADEMKRQLADMMRRLNPGFEE